MLPVDACAWCCGDLTYVTFAVGRRLVCPHCGRPAAPGRRGERPLSGYEEDHELRRWRFEAARARRSGEQRWPEPRRWMGPHAA